MNENFHAKLNNIDSLLSDFAPPDRHSELLNQIDSLCSEVDLGFKNRTTEITEMPVQAKRAEVIDSKDTHLLNVLSMDQNFNVRSLSACNPETPIVSLRRLVENSNDYIKLIVANNPSTPPDLLDRIVELSSENEVLHAVKVHPNVSAVTKYKIEIKQMYAK